MTPQEFKAWFEGFTEAFDRVPTKAQWARVKARVAEIDGKPVTEKVFVDRYWPTHIPYYREYRPYWAYVGPGGVSGASCGAVGMAQASNASYQSAANNMNQGSFDSGHAMLALGRADAKAIQ